MIHVRYILITLLMRFDTLYTISFTFIHFDIHEMYSNYTSHAVWHTFETLSYTLIYVRCILITLLMQFNTPSKHFHTLWYTWDVFLLHFSCRLTHLRNTSVKVDTHKMYFNYTSHAVWHTFNTISYTFIHFDIREIHFNYTYHAVWHTFETLS